MDEDLKGSVDFDFFDDDRPKTAEQVLPPSPLTLTAKPPTPTKGKSKHVVPQLIHDEAHANNHSDYIENKVITSKYASHSAENDINEFLVSKVRKTSTTSFDQSVTLTESQEYMDDFESDEDNEINRQCKPLEPLHSKPKSTITIPSDRSSDYGDSVRSQSNRTYSVSSASSSAFSQSDRSGSDTDSDHISGAKYNKRNVTFSNDKQLKHPSGRKSRLSSHEETRTEKHGSDKSSGSSKYKKKTSRERRRKRRSSHSSDSSSEITDVSPLSSVENSPRTHGKSKKHIGYLDYKNEKAQCSDFNHDKVDNNLSKPKRDTMEFKLLMQAVQELDKDKEKHSKRSTSKKHHLSGGDNNFHDDDRNYSFSMHQCKLIEQENRRLMQKLSKNRQPKRSQSTGLLQRRLPSSAVNRYREQKKIEMENYDFLRRLGNIRPTKGLTRGEQLQEYHKRMQFGSGTRKTNGRKLTSQASMSDESSILSGPSSCASVASLKSSTSINSRISSGSRMSSDTRSRTSSTGSRMTLPREPRPAWDSRW